MKWKLEQRNVKELCEYGKNARRISRHDAMHLEESLGKFGQCQPIVINTDNVVVGGHQRLRTLRKMGHKTVDVYVPDTPLDEKEVAELNIRLNRNLGEWDWDMLANDWDQVDLSQYGFTDKELCVERLEGEDGGAEESSTKKTSMTVTFQSLEDLQDAENHIAAIVDRYEGAHYTVRTGDAEKKRSASNRN